MHRDVVRRRDQQDHQKGRRLRHHQREPARPQPPGLFLVQFRDIDRQADQVCRL